LKGAIANQDFEALVATVEAHLAEAPNDIEGWKVLAPAYKRERRWSDAADAYANVLRLTPPTADAIADYGEMLVFANEGMVTAEAEGAFAEALKLEATNERAKYYYDMALKQEGKAPALSDEQVAAVQAMPAQDQTAMIAGMMDGLEQKLGRDSRDLEGWKRLIRARRISNEIDKAKISLDLAMNVFKDDPASLDALRELAKELGIAE
jgi:cytochrome c-type biogenesis protein CcmH